MKNNYLINDFGLDENSPLYNYLLDNLDNFTLASYVDYLGNNYNSLAICHIDKFDKRKELTYKDLSIESNKMANYLKSLGVNKKDIIALVLRNNLEFFIGVLAIQKLGAIVIPLQFNTKTEQYNSIFKRTNPKCIIADDYEIVQSKNHSSFVLNEINKATNKDVIKLCTYPNSDYVKEGNWKELSNYQNYSDEFTSETVSIHDIGYIFATSGTTGEPKLPMHENGFALAHYNTGKWYGLEKGKKHFTITDSGWAMASWSMCANLLHQSVLYVEDYSRFNEESLLKHMNNEKVESLCAPRAMLIRFINHIKNNDVEIPKLNSISSAGEYVDELIRNEVKKYFNVDIKEGYGMTELVLALYQNNKGDFIKNNLYDSIEVENLKDLPTGEIVIKTRYGRLGLTKGYLDKKDNLKLTYRELPIENGFVIWHTGDAGYYDENNIVHCDGRLGNTVKVNDCLVNKTQVESIIRQLDYVNECIVESRPDSISGNVLDAYVELKGNLDVNDEMLERLKKEIPLYVKKNLPDYARPKNVYFGKIERTSNGKIKRKDIITPPDKNLVLKKILLNN